MIMFNYQLHCYRQQNILSHLRKFQGSSNMKGTVVGATKKMLVMMLLLAVVVIQAQAQEVPPPNPSTFPEQKKFYVNCPVLCFGRCQASELPYMKCFDQCMSECNHSVQNAAVFDCTKKCIVSKTTAFKLGMIFYLILLYIFVHFSLSGLYYLVDQTCTTVSRS